MPTNREQARTAYRLPYTPEEHERLVRIFVAQIRLVAYNFLFVVGLNWINCEQCRQVLGWSVHSIPLMGTERSLSSFGMTLLLYTILPHQVTAKEIGISSRRNGKGPRKGSPLSTVSGLPLWECIIVVTIVMTCKKWRWRSMNGTITSLSNI